MFSIKNTTLKDIDFTCNFKGSEKIEINTNQESVNKGWAPAKKQAVKFDGHKLQTTPEGDIILKAEIKMKTETPEKGFVCSVVLKQNWKLKTKFTVSLKNNTPQIQRQHLEKADSLVEKVKEFKDQFSKIAFTQMSIENIMILLAARF